MTLCYADGEKLTTAIEEIIAGLDLSEIESVFGDVGYFDGNAADNLRAFLTGDVGVSLSDVTNAAIKLVIGNIGDFLPEICAVLGVCIFGCVLEAIRPSRGAAVGESGFFVVIAVVITLTSSLVFSALNAAKSAINLMTAEIQAVFPVMLTLISASGAGVTVSTLQPSLAYVCTAESVVAESVLLPVTIGMLVFGAANGVSKSFKLGKTNEFLKSVFKWTCGASSLFFTFFVTAQGVAAATFDGFSLKALKYVVGSGVPIVSQFINGGFDVVFASCILVKNSLGLFALVFLVATVLSPLIKIAVLSLFLRFLAACTEPVADERVVKFVSSSADALNFVAAALISVAVVYFISVFVVLCLLGVSV